MSDLDLALSACWWNIELILRFKYNSFAVAATVDMNCKCYAVGLKFVNIVWEPLPQDPESSLQPSYYRVFFCTSWSCNSLVQAGQYHLGCTLNTTQQSLKQKELQCRIAGETLFPLSFYFILEMRNVSGVFISRRKTCRLHVLNRKFNFLCIQCKWYVNSLRIFQCVGHYCWIFQ